MAALDGFLVIDKPAGITSRAAVNQVQAWLPRHTRLGHAGTLDPLATGVLVIGIGQATRLIEYVQDLPKAYRSTFRLDARSTTDDADGLVTPVEGVVPIELSRIEAALQRFVGDIQQTPPAFSAAKVTGRRAYDLARQGQAVALKPRPVHVDAIRVLRCEWPRLDVEVECGKGTYIRSIARDLGTALGCGGLVEVLRRTRIGPFQVDQAVALSAGPATVLAQLRPLGEAVAHLPRVEVTAADAVRLRLGQALAGAASGEAALFCAGDLVAMAIGTADQQRWQPTKVFH